MEYSFRLEPIEWNKHENLLVARNVMTACPFLAVPDEGSNRQTYSRIINGSSVENNNYEYSEVRAFLNGNDFYDYAGNLSNKYRENPFLKKAFTVSAIEAITSGNEGYNTDKVFLLENSSNHWPSLDADSITDYAKATGTSVVTNRGNWTRTEYASNTVSVNGTQSNLSVFDSFVGVVPALYLSNF